MSELEVQNLSAPAPQIAGLSQWQRVTNTFTAPSKTFADIQQGNKSWWLPFLLMILVSYLFFGVITAKIGWNQVAENAMHLNPKAEARMAQAPVEQQEMTKKITVYSMEGSFAASPVFVLAGVALMAVILMATINFGFGGKAKFGSVFTVWMYASLPSIIKTVLGVIVIFAGMAPESFNLSNFAPTNLGAFLNPLETNMALYKFASAIDIITLWTMVLLGMGVATVAGLKKSSGYAAVFGWWALIVLVTVGWAAAFS